MAVFKHLRSFSYGISAAVVFFALLYASDIGSVRGLFGEVPNPSGILIILGGLCLIFVGVGMLMARMTGNKHEF